MSLEISMDTKGNWLFGVKDSQGVMEIRRPDNVIGEVPKWPHFRECLIVGKAEWDAVMKALDDARCLIYRSEPCMIGIKEWVTKRDAVCEQIVNLRKLDSASPPETRKEAAE